MQAAGKLEIRLFTSNDIPFAMELKDLAGWNQTQADWQRFLTLEPEGCFLALCDGKPAGTTIAITYGKEMAWIAMVLVHPEMRGKGIGRALVEHALSWLKKNKVKTVKLDATEEGKNLYRKLGFQEEYEIDRWQGWGKTKIDFDLPVIQQSDVEEIDRFDAFYFGTSRKKVLKRLLAEFSGMGFLSRGENGALSGYGLCRYGQKAWHIGPCVACSATVAEKIFVRLLGLIGEKPVYIDVIRKNETAGQIVLAHGFTVQRHLTRMYLGPNQCPGFPAGIFAISGGEKG